MMRVGIGYDVHRLVKGRPLILGGINVQHETGLLGHSDADVLVHSACDALLGAAGLGDLGQHFSDNDEAYKNIYSIHILEQCVQMIKQQGYQLINMDAVIFAQVPKLMPYRSAMENRLAQAMKVPKNAINIKATTTEGLGFVGRQEGMAAQCIVLIDSIS